MSSNSTIPDSFYLFNCWVKFHPSHILQQRSGTMHNNHCFTYYKCVEMRCPDVLQLGQRSFTDLHIASILVLPRSLWTDYVVLLQEIIRNSGPSRIVLIKMYAAHSPKILISPSFFREFYQSVLEFPFRIEIVSFNCLSLIEGNTYSVRRFVLYTLSLCDMTSLLRILPTKQGRRIGVNKGCVNKSQITAHINQRKHFIRIYSTIH